MPKVTANPNICHGKACISGTRIPVHIVLDLLAAGETFDGILKAYPHLSREDIYSCIEYAANLAKEEIIYESVK